MVTFAPMQVTDRSNHSHNQSDATSADRSSKEISRGNLQGIKREYRKIRIVDRWDTLQNGIFEINLILTYIKVLLMCITAMAAYLQWREWSSSI